MACLFRGACFLFLAGKQIVWRNYHLVWRDYRLVWRNKLIFGENITQFGEINSKIGEIDVSELETVIGPALPIAASGRPGSVLSEYTPDTIYRRPVNVAWNAILIFV